MPKFRYKKLGYIALNVTDLDRSTAFYRDVVGLDLSEEAEGAERTAYLRSGADHHTIVLSRAEEAGLKRIGWELEDEGELERAFDGFGRLGLQPTWIGDDERRALCQGPSFRLREPHTRACFEITPTCR